MISSGINLVMTVIGFAVSTMFIVFVCTRLICARIQLNASRRSFHMSSRSDLSIVSSISICLLSGLLIWKFSFWTVLCVLFGPFCTCLLVVNLVCVNYLPLNKWCYPNLAIQAWKLNVPQGFKSNKVYFVTLSIYASSAEMFWLHLLGNVWFFVLKFCFLIIWIYLFNPKYIKINKQKK